MNKFSFLSTEEKSTKETLKKIGYCTTATDFSLLLGLECCHQREYDNSLKKELKIARQWWSNVNDYYGIEIFKYYGSIMRAPYNERSVGARPATLYNFISNEATNKKIRDDGLLEVDYGEYPQMIAHNELCELLEMEYLNGNLPTTGKVYTTDSSVKKYNSSNFNPKEHIEYEYKGRKFIRILGNKKCIEKYLNNGEKIINNKPYWVEVQPITWIVNEEYNIALSKRILFAGILYKTNSVNEPFSYTNICDYLNTYFSQEIIPAKTNYIMPTFIENNEKNKENNLIEQLPLKEDIQYNIVNEIPEKTHELSEETLKYKLSIEEDKNYEVIINALECNIPLYFYGKQFSGKSSRVKELDPNCIVIYLKNATIESINGKVLINPQTDEVVYAKPTWLEKLEKICELEPNKKHIVYIDDIQKAEDTVMSAALSIIFNREINNLWKLPENSRIIVSSHKKKNMPVIDEFSSFIPVYIETCTEEWVRWATKNNIHPKICTYIAYKGDKVLWDDDSGINPKKWEIASKMLYKTEQPRLLISLLGEKVVDDFIKFLDVKPVSLQTILNGEYDLNDLYSMTESERYVTAMAMSQIVDDDNLNTVRIYFISLGKKVIDLFDALWIHGDESRFNILNKIKNEGKKL